MQTLQRAILLVLAMFLVACAPATVDEPQATQRSLFAAASTAANAAAPELIGFRRDLHQYPELAGSEVRTARKLTDALTKLGLPVQTGVGGHGVVALVNGARPGPMVAFRADMDAVAGAANDDVSYRSRVEGVHHICGHDIHTAVGLGLATALTAIQDELPGQVMLIFQPAEEAGTGAVAMLSDGVFEQATPKTIFALHSAPLNLGTVAAIPGGMMAGRTAFTIDIRTSDNLDAKVDAVRQRVNELGNITPETMLDYQAAPFVFIDLFSQPPAQAGRATVSGLIMAADLDWRSEVNKNFQNEILALADETTDITVDLTQALEGVNNSETRLDAARRAIAALAPDIKVASLPGVIPAFSEDFGSFQQRSPGVMFFLGVNNPTTGTIGFPHHPDFIADDGAIAVGIDAMLAAVLDALMRSDEVSRSP